MNHLDREQFVAAVESMTYAPEEVELRPGAWFDLVTAPESGGVITALTHGSESSCRRLATNKVIYRGALSTKCVPSEVTLWTVGDGFCQYLFVGPISSKALREAMVPKLKTQEDQARRLIIDVLKGFAREDRMRSSSTVRTHLRTSACVLTVEDEGRVVTYLGSLCTGAPVTFKLDLESMTTDQLVDLYVNRLMHLRSASWGAAFEAESLLAGAPASMDWKFFPGGIAADLGPRLSVRVKNPYSQIMLDGSQIHNYFTPTIQSGLKNLYDEVSRFIAHMLVQKVNREVFRAVMVGLPADLATATVTVANEHLDRTRSTLRDTEVHYANSLRNLHSDLQKAEVVFDLVNGTA